jgi:hypothetical protein
MQEHEVIKIFWEDYKMRQAHYWSSLTRFTLAIITLWVLPYIRPDVVRLLGLLVLIFPAIALLLSVASFWLLGAEYQRLQAVKRRIEGFSDGVFKLTYPSERWWHKFFGAPIGTITTWVFGFVFVALSLLDICLLIYAKDQLMALKGSG